MKCLRYRVTLLSPVIIHSAAGDENMTATGRFIPGNALIGVFAARYLMKKPVPNVHLDSQFYQWFLEGGLIFTPAYPVVDDGGKNKYLYPLPLSLRQEKRGAKPQERLQIIDALIEPDQSYSEIVGGYGDIFYETVYRDEVAVTFHAHHERERESGTSKKGIFFYYEALEAGQEFQFEIRGNEDLVEAFSHFFESEFEARLGKSRNAEYGRVLIHKSPNTSSIPAFSNKGNELILTFISPCILRNQMGYPDLSIGYIKTYLAEVLGIDTEEILIDKAYLREATIETYLSVWRMKRPAERALAPGSVVKIYFGQVDDKLLERVSLLQANGLGERRNEGYGQVKINWLHPSDGKYILETPNKEKRKKPDGPMPDTVRPIFQEVFWFHLNLQAKHEALIDYKLYSNRPKNSLLGRLQVALTNHHKKEEFITEVTSWGLTAKEALTGCVSEAGHNLLDEMKDDRRINQVLQNFKEEIKTAMTVEQLEGLGLGDNGLRTNDVLIYPLYQTYWRTVLDEMRKQNKLDVGAEELK